LTPFTHTTIEGPMRIFTIACGLFLAGFAGTAGAASSPDLIAKGEYLARAGDCVVCHTGPGEKQFAGGLRMSTPLGDIYTTNITPDKETGIGDDSFDDFERAMRHGVARDGHRLYPAMPYPSYAKVSKDDLRALYAFFMESVPAASRKNSPSEIRWPLNMRWPLRLWDKIFTDAIGYTQDPAHDEAWNRGAYLVQGLGHCGSCHTPRGIFFQEKALDGQRAAYLSGGNLDNWFASSLRADPDFGLAGWSVADIATFLKTGHNTHATAFGTMIDAINNSTQYLTEADLTAIGTYLKSLPANQPTATVAGAATNDKAYLQQCAACHLPDGKGHAPYIAPLAANPAVMDPDPSSLINITLNGSSRVVVDGMPDAYRMPQFRVLLKDDEIADIVSFIRGSWGNKAAPVTADQVGKIRKATEAASDAVVILKMR
jgi:mono/diheme cytochrome c family protein